MAVGLEPLKDLLAVVEHGSGGIQGHRAVGLQARIIPLPVSLFHVTGPVDGDHVVREMYAETGVGQDGVPDLVGGRVGIGLADEMGAQECSPSTARIQAACRAATIWSPT